MLAKYHKIRISSHSLTQLIIVKLLIEKSQGKKLKSKDKDKDKIGALLINKSIFQMSDKNMRKKKSNANLHQDSFDILKAIMNLFLESSIA